MSALPLTREQFEAAISSRVFNFHDPRVERDGEYAYDCFDDADGNELGFISYRGGEIVGYTLTDAAVTE